MPREPIWHTQRTGSAQNPMPSAFPIYGPAPSEGFTVLRVLLDIVAGAAIESTGTPHVVVLHFGIHVAVTDDGSSIDTSALQTTDWMWLGQIPMYRARSGGSEDLLFTPYVGPMQVDTRARRRLAAGESVWAAWTARPGTVTDLAEFDIQWRVLVLDPE